MDGSLTTPILHSLESVKSAKRVMLTWFAKRKKGIKEGSEGEKREGGERERRNVL